MDSEAIYKNFVLRVSPNQRFLCSIGSSGNNPNLLLDWFIHTGNGSKESQCKTSENTQ